MARATPSSPSTGHLRAPRTTHAVLVLLLAVSAFCFIVPSLPSSSAGGGRSFNTGTWTDPSFVAVSGASTGNTGTLSNFIQNDYIVVVVSFVGTGQTVSTVVDSVSPATSFLVTTSSNTNQDTEIWCGKYTAASGSDMITVTSTASATYDFTFYLLGGLSGCSGATTATNHGSGAAMSVASFTPATGAACVGEGTENTGSSATFTDANPFLADHNLGGAPLTSLVFGTHNYAVSILRASWNSNDGSTTATLTPSVSSSPTWDEVIACYSTLSQGNELYNEGGPRGGLRSGASPQTAGIDTTLNGDYLLALWGSIGTGTTVSSVTFSAQAGYTTTTPAKVAQANVHDDTELWIAQAQATSISGSPQVSIAFTPTGTEYVVWSLNIGSILSTTAQTTSSAGASGSSASVASFTPNAGDLCVAQLTAVTTTSGERATVANNLPFSGFYTSSSTGSNLFGVAVRADWPTGVSTTATFTLSSGTFTSYDELVTCFPGTVIVPLTCTMANSAPQATMTLSESNGNSLSPSTVACNGAVHNIAVDPSATLTATEPADGANNRDRFSGGTTMMTDASCGGSASGACPAWSFTNYDQLQNTYQVIPLAQTTWDSGLTFTLTGTLLGVVRSTVCTIPPPGGSGTQSCTAWADYDKGVFYPVNPTGAASNTRWMLSGDGAVYLTTGGNTGLFDYYKQLLNAYQATPFKPSTWDFSGLSVDAHSITNCGSASCTSAAFSTANANDVIVVLIAGGGNSAPATYTISDLSGLALTSRLSCTAFGDSSFLCEYYAVASSTIVNDKVTVSTTGCAVGGCSKLSFEVLAISGANTISPFDSHSGLPVPIFNVDTTAISCAMSTNYANDLLVGYLTSHYPSTGYAGPSGWTTLDTSSSSAFGLAEYNIVSSTSSSVTYTWSWSPVGAAYNALLCDAVQAAIQGVVATGTSLGLSGQTICVTSLPTAGSSSPISCSGWADYNAPVIMGALTVSGNERWAPATLTYTDTTGGNTHTDDYYEQLLNTYTASPTLGAGGTTWDYTGANDISVSYSSAGALATCNLTTVGGGGAVSCGALWVDYSTAVTFGTLTVSATEQWVPSTHTSSFTDTSGGNTRTGDYSRQWQVQFAVAPSSGYGSISPSATAFYNDSSAVAITATANPGYSFVNWTASTAFILFASTANPSTTAGIHAAGTVTANFITISITDAVADVYSFSEAATRSLALQQTSGDAAPYTESASTQLGFDRTVGEAASLSDTVSRSLGLSGIVSDVTSYAEGGSTTLSFVRNAVETAGFGDGPNALAGLLRVASDSIPVADVTARLLHLTQAVADAVNYVDGLQAAERTVKSIVASIGDAYIFAESNTRTLTLSRLISDTTSLSETLTRMLSQVRGVTDASLFGALQGRTLALFDALTDLLQLVENAAAALASSIVTSSTSSSSSSASSSSSSTSTTTSSRQTGSPGSGLPPATFLVLAFLALLMVVLVIYLLTRRRRKETGLPVL